MDLGKTHTATGQSRLLTSRFQLESAINVTPFVDVVLVLLIVFMITAPLLTTGVTLDLPRAEAKSIENEGEPLTLSINREGEVFIQDTAIENDALTTRLEALAGEDAERRIFIRGDRGVDYGRVMEVMSVIHLAGFTHVALVTLPDATPASTSDEAS